MPSMNELQRVAVEAVADSCAIARRVQEDLQNVRRITKDDRSPVTVADFAVQAIVSLRLTRALGHVCIVGEEHAQLLREPERAAIRDAVINAVRSIEGHVSGDDILNAIDACDHDATADQYWTLDPIDGTKGFLRGEQYAIALGLIEQGHVTMGVLGCPNLPISDNDDLEQLSPSRGILCVAVRGEGARIISAATPDDTGVPLRSATSVDASALRTCESVEKAHSRQSDTQRILEAMGARSIPVRLDSQCKYAVVARGLADAYLRLPTSATYVEKIWDHAAGMLVATEAGARVTDVHGHDLDFSRGKRLEANRGIICAAKPVHGRIIETIESLGLATAAAT